MSRSCIRRQSGAGSARQRLASLWASLPSGGRLQHGSIQAQYFADRRYMNLELTLAGAGARPYAIHNMVPDTILFG
jgi:hypothetical protein